MNIAYAKRYFEYVKQHTDLSLRQSNIYIFFASVITLAIACLFVDVGTFTVMVSCCLKFVSKETLSKTLMIVLVITFFVSLYKSS